MTEKYKLLPEHSAQLDGWARRWIANAMSTAAMTDEDREICRDAVRRLYRAGGIEPPPDHRIVFVPSPFVLRFASGFAAAIWHLRKEAATASATRDATRDATAAVTRDATRDATAAATRDATAAATRAVTAAATWAATEAATASATRDATRDATEAATWAATEAVTRDATGAATEVATWDATRDATEAATRDATEAATGATTWDATGAATRDATQDATWAATRAATRTATEAVTASATRAATASATADAIAAATRDATAAATRDATASATAAAIWAATYAAIAAATEAAIWDATRDATEVATWDATRDATRTATINVDKEDLSQWYVFSGDVIGLSRFIGVNKLGLKFASSNYFAWQGGNQWSSHASFLSFFRYIAKLGIDYSAWDAWEILSERSGPRIVCSEFCMISDRPEVLLVDDENRPHCDTGPFCRWRDGSALYAVHGVRVPAWIIERQDAITVANIDAEENAEIRRIMIDRYGAARYLENAGAVLVHCDDWGSLYRRDQDDDEPLIMVKVANSTPDSDGTFKDYWIRVHPELRPMLPDGSLGDPQEMTARNAVASTFGLTGKYYRPCVQT